MKKRQVWRYTCDHCKKSNCSAASIRTHELHCTANPARVCRMCVKIQGEQKPLDVLKAALAKDCAVPDIEKKEIDVKHLSEEATGCPCCMLAAIRQGESLIPTFTYQVYQHFDRDVPTGVGEPAKYHVKFDFKAAMKSIFHDINEERNASLRGDY